MFYILENGRVITHKHTVKECEILIQIFKNQDSDYGIAKKYEVKESGTFDRD